MHNPSMSGRHGMSCCLVILALFWHLSACVAQHQTPLQDAVFQPQYDAALDRGSQGSYPVREYHSTKTMVPKFNYLKWTPECEDRNAFYFITPKGWKVDNPGPMILDYKGDLVWFEHFDNEFGGQAYDLMVQEYLGEKFLTFWLGDDRIRGHGAGHFHMINPAYDTIHRIGAGNERSADLHEFRLTPQGTALIVIFEPISFDVRPAGREFDDVWNQYMWDCLIQEVDIRSKNVLFEWRASEHLDIKDSFKRIVDRSQGTAETPYDPFHFNSVEKDDLGNYLVSARYTHAIYYISGSTKEVIWTLGGLNNTFMDLSPISPLNFAWQHDARFVDVNAFPETYVPPPTQEGSTTRLLSLFDNAAEDWNYNQGPANARGLLLEITYPTTAQGPQPPKPVRSPDEIKQMLKETAKATTMSGIDAHKVAAINGTDPAYTVRLVQQYANTATGRASSQGSMQLIGTEPGKDPHVLLGHGINAVAEEYSGNGTLLCNMHFAAQSSWELGDVQSYRVMKFFDWVGRPHVPPDVAVSGNYAYASWNGATGVDEWLLQTWDGNEGEHWAAAGVPVKRTGFETQIEIPKDRRKSKFLRVTAIDAGGQACEHGVSDALERGYLYGRQKRTYGHTYGQILLFAVAGFAGFLLSIRLLKRCYARFQRRRFAKWRLP